MNLFDFIPATLVTLPGAGTERAQVARPLSERVFDPEGFEALERAYAECAWGKCKWPIGDPGDHDFRFCCGPAASRNYCDIHARLSRYGKRRQS